MACVIEFKGKNYSYDEFATMLHDGGLKALIDEKVIDPSKFSQVESSRLTKKEASEKEAELKAAAKPEIEMDYITDRDALSKETEVTFTNSEGKKIKGTATILEQQTDIRRSVGMLKELINCLHA